jgi:hypothetical protein
MDKEQLIQQRKLLYGATDLKLQLVDKLIKSIKECFGKHIETTNLHFDSSCLELGGLTVKMIEIDPQELGGVLVHWYPRPSVSTKQDPFCSIYMLTIKEIKKIIKKIQAIHAYHLAQQKQPHSRIIIIDKR